MSQEVMRRVLITFTTRSVGIYGNRFIARDLPGCRTVIAE